MSTSLAFEPPVAVVFRRALVAALTCQALSFFLFCCALWMPPPGRFIKQYEPMTHHPLSHLPTDDEPQTRHRILGPCIAYLLGLHGLASAAVPIVAGTLMLWCVYLFAWYHLDRQWAFWVTLLVATTQTFISSQTWIGFQDAMGGAAIAGCFLVRRSWLAAIFVFLGMLAEERCAVGVPFVVLWHASQSATPWRTGVRWSLALGLAMVCWGVYFYYAIRHLVPAELWTMYDPMKSDPVVMGTSLQCLKQNINHLALGYFESIRGGWILLGYAAWILFQRKRWVPLVLGGGAVLAGLFQGGMVSDISRSSANIWPALLLALAVLQRYGAEQSFWLLRLATLFNVFTPCYQVLGTVVQYYFPLPISLLRLIYRV